MAYSFPRIVSLPLKSVRERSRLNKAHAKLGFVFGSARSLTYWQIKINGNSAEWPAARTIPPKPKTKVESPARKGGATTTKTSTQNGNDNLYLKNHIDSLSRRFNSAFSSSKRAILSSSPPRFTECLNLSSAKFSSKEVSLL